MNTVKKIIFKVGFSIGYVLGKMGIKKDSIEY